MVEEAAIHPNHTGSAWRAWAHDGWSTWTQGVSQGHFGTNLRFLSPVHPQQLWGSAGHPRRGLQKGLMSRTLSAGHVRM